MNPFPLEFKLISLGLVGSDQYYWCKRKRSLTVPNDTLARTSYSRLSFNHDSEDFSIQNTSNDTPLQPYTVLVKRSYFCQSTICFGFVFLLFFCFCLFVFFAVSSFYLYCKDVFTLCVIVVGRVKGTDPCKRIYFFMYNLQ